MCSCVSFARRLGGLCIDSTGATNFCAEGTLGDTDAHLNGRGADADPNPDPDSGSHRAGSPRGRDGPERRSDPRAPQQDHRLGELAPAGPSLPGRGR